MYFQRVPLADKQLTAEVDLDSDYWYLKGLINDISVYCTEYLQTIC